MKFVSGKPKTPYQGTLDTDERHNKHYMYDYNEVYQNCDKVLDYMVAHNGRVSRSDLKYVLSKGFNVHSAIQHLVDDNCIKEFPVGSSYYDIITKGTEIHGNGGYKELFERLKKQQEEQKEKDALTDKKLKVDLANAERVYKTYFSTRAMAITATIISIALLLLRLAEVFGWLGRPKQ